MSFNDGDFVRIDYTARRASDKSLVYTTIEKVAKDNGLYNEGSKYGPQLVVVGRNSVIKGIDDAVRVMSVGEEKKLDIAPLNAFGERREDMVSVMPMADFRKREINPVPGMQIDIDGVLATVKSVNSGRVVVDANHPLAGETLTYDIKVVQRLDSEKEKVKALADYYGLSASNVEVSESSAKIYFDAKVKKDSDYLVNKAGLVDAAFKYFSNMDKVIVDEEYAREKAGADKQ